MTSPHAVQFSLEQLEELKNKSVVPAVRRASRTGSRKSYAAMVGMLPQPLNPLVSPAESKKRSKKRSSSSLSLETATSPPEVRISTSIVDTSTSPDFVQFSLEQLQELKETSIREFNMLDFSDYTLNVIDALFPKRTHGQRDPLASYRTSSRKLREWRGLTTKGQQYLIDTEREKTKSQTPYTGPALTTTGRASRTGSRKSYAAMVGKVKLPPSQNPLFSPEEVQPNESQPRQDTDDSARSPLPVSKRGTKERSSSSSPLEATSPEVQPNESQPRQETDESARSPRPESKKGTKKRSSPSPPLEAKIPEVPVASVAAQIQEDSSESPEDTSPDFVQFSLEELEELKETSIREFNKLSFLDYTIDVIDALFPKKIHGQLDPPASYLTSSRKLREWRGSTTKGQQYLIDNEREKAKSQTPIDPDLTVTGRAVRTGSRKSYIAVKKERRKRPRSRQAADVSALVSSPETKKPMKKRLIRSQPPIEAPRLDTSLEATTFAASSADVSALVSSRETKKPLKKRSIMSQPPLEEPRRDTPVEATSSAATSVAHLLLMLSKK
jgi:hypothetical protein